MLIIQTIRDKGAAIVIVVIALSLIGFILMDSSQSGGLFNPISTTVGKVNGEEIDLNLYNNKYRAAQMMEEQRTGQPVSGLRSYQLREEVFNQIVAEKIFTDEAAKLGITFTAKELSHILLSDDPQNPLLQEAALRDPATGKLNMAEAQRVLSNIKKLKGEQKANINQQLVNPLKLSSTVTKYTALLNASAYYPTWMEKRDEKFASEFSTISYVQVPFYEFPDSTFKVTDAEINAYVAKNKALFKQEKGKRISYLAFSQLPSKEDSAKIENQLLELKPVFEQDTAPAIFVAKNMSVIEYEDKLKPKSAYQSVYIDAIIANPAGYVVGPYVENNSYILAKMVATGSLPDSVKARHILIPTHNLQTGEVIRDEESAKNLADSLLNLINNGADFAALAAQFSVDGSKDQGGDLGTFTYGQMVPEFNDFTFTKPVGSKGVVRTQFGYHVIEITQQKNFNPAYKIAFLAKEILSSDETINKASLEAATASSLKGAKNLEEYAKINNLNYVSHPIIVQENDYMIGNMTDARSIVRWVNDAKPGDVSEPFSVGNDFVVVTIDKEYKEGLQDAETARAGAEPILLKQKKTEMIVKKMGENPTLEAAAAAFNKTIMTVGEDSTMTMNSQIIAGLGVEPKVIGAAFNKNYMQKASAPFAGNSGVYVIKVNQIGKTENAAAVMLNMSQNRLNAQRNANSSWYESLRKLAKIKDERSKHF